MLHASGVHRTGVQVSIRNRIGRRFAHGSLNGSRRTTGTPLASRDNMLFLVRYQTLVQSDFVAWQNEHVGQSGRIERKGAGDVLLFLMSPGSPPRVRMHTYRVHTEDGARMRVRRNFLRAASHTNAA